MTFEEALKNLKEGKNIRRKADYGWFALNNVALLRYKPSSYRIGELVRGDASFSLADVLAEDWEVIGGKKQWWKPKFDETYWSITPWSGAVRTCYNDHKVDGIAMSMGLCFQTEEQADFMVEKLKVIHELEKFAFENNEEEIDWNNEKQRKFFLYYSYSANQVLVNYVISMKENPFNIYFTSTEIAEKAIETIGEDRIKKYYFGVEENGRK